jgi:peroxiredoxin (alkyl hydroperoxide reductase subunit C)
MTENSSSMMTTENLMNVDWSSLPVPEDDGAADHLINSTVPSVSLPSTDNQSIALSSLTGKTVIYIYPRTGQPGQSNPDGWDAIPGLRPIVSLLIDLGARGCTPQSCSFRDHAKELHDLGIKQIYGLSTQDTEYQKEVVNRLHLPFPILSDEKIELTHALQLPTFDVQEVGTLLKRMVLILENDKIIKVFYPVFPPEGSAREVVEYLRSRQT